MTLDTGAVTVSSIAIGQTVVAYQFFLPKLSEVRHADSTDTVTRGDVYLGQIAAGALSISVGGTMTMLTGSKIPLFTSILIACIIAGTYHYALRSAP